MNGQVWPVGIKTIGELSEPELAAKLAELGEPDNTHPGDNAPAPPDSYGGHWWPSIDRPWKHTAHTIGFIPALRGQKEAVRLIHAASVMADDSLKGSRVKITLDRIRAADYPGGGTHTILVDISARDQNEILTDDLHFAMVYRIREQQSAGVFGYPVFIGLPVGTEGLSLSLVTVNICNDEDERFLKILESDSIKAGLQLLNTWQPALVPLSALARGITVSMAERTRNVAVQKIMMGLDFAPTPTGLGLAEGAYVAVQVPEALNWVWDWSQWIYDPRIGDIIMESDHDKSMPFNYVIIGISRYNDPDRTR